MGDEDRPVRKTLQEGQRDASQKARVHSEPTSEPPQDVRPQPTAESPASESSEDAGGGKAPKEGSTGGRG
jgi:hypothetical protein